jgi:hypothetical protein
VIFSVSAIVYRSEAGNPTSTEHPETPFGTVSLSTKIRGRICFPMISHPEAQCTVAATPVKAGDPPYCGERQGRKAAADRSWSSMPSPEKLFVAHSRSLTKLGRRLLIANYNTRMLGEESIRTTLLSHVIVMYSIWLLVEKRIRNPFFSHTLS